MAKQSLSEHYPILVVDDNPVNRQVLCHLLKQLGLQCESVDSGMQAVSRAKSHSFGAILMDVMMPEMDGYETARRIREDEFATGMHTPIIACTALDLENTREQCLEAGMDDFLMKPISQDVLRERLERWLKQPVAQLLTRFKDNLEQAVLTDDPINKEKLRLLYGTDQIDDILQIFVMATEALLIDLKAGITEKSKKEVGRIAHELKGSAFSVSAEQVGLLARQLEVASRDQNWAEALQIYVEISKAFADVRKGIAQLWAQAGPRHLL